MVLIRLILSTNIWICALPLNTISNKKQLELATLYKGTTLLGIAILTKLNANPKHTGYTLGDEHNRYSMVDLCPLQSYTYQYVK